MSRDQIETLTLVDSDNGAQKSYGHCLEIRKEKEQREGEEKKKKKDAKRWRERTNAERSSERRGANWKLKKMIIFRFFLVYFI